MKRHAFAVFLMSVILVGLLAACSQKPATPEPPEILYGHDVCSRCGMQIDEARFAAATLLTSGEYLKFDDIGEMLVYHMEHPVDQVNAWFVHDYETEDWLRGETAYYARSAELKTPMGYGIVAFADQKDAETFASEHGGQIFSLDELRADVHIQVHGSHPSQTTD